LVAFYVFEAVLTFLLAFPYVYISRQKSSIKSH